MRCIFLFGTELKSGDLSKGEFKYAFSLFCFTGEVVAFSVSLSHQLGNIQGEQIIIFNHVILNEAEGYDESTGIFICPQDGVYLFTFFIGRLLF